MHHSGGLRWSPVRKIYYCTTVPFDKQVLPSRRSFHQGALHYVCTCYCMHTALEVITLTCSVTQHNSYTTFHFWESGRFARKHQKATSWYIITVDSPVDSQLLHKYTWFVHPSVCNHELTFHISYRHTSWHTCPVPKCGNVACQVADR